MVAPKAIRGVKAISEIASYGSWQLEKEMLEHYTFSLV
jgi:hypothetical protein